MANLHEIWKQIPSFPDYLVSSLGRVKTTSRPLRYIHAVTGKEHFRQSTERFLKIQHNKRTGYKFHQVYKEQKMYNRPVHILVADAFIANPDNLPVINHKDGNKHNNVVDNLERCTNEYNHEHATKTGLKPFGSRVGTSVFNDHSVLAVKRMIASGQSHSKIAKWFGVSRATITMINTGETWRRVSLTGTELEIKI